MNLDWLESFLYGFISGLAELLPISAQAHQTIMMRLFGVTDNIALVKLLTHCGVLAGLYYATKDHLQVLYREMRLLTIPKRRRRRQPEQKSVMEIKLLKTAFWGLLFGFLFYPVARLLQNKVHIVGLFLILNGIIILAPQFLFGGNKDARRMTVIDGILLGLANAMCVLPGISRIAMSTTLSLARGVDRRNALHWAYCLSIPTLVFFIGFDVYDVFALGIGIAGFLDVIKCFLAAISGFIGAYSSVSLMRFISVNTGFYAFGYYSWGAALFSFILFLTI